MKDEKFWWHHILAIPSSKHTNGFKRIERIIRDKTRYGRKQGERLHELYNTDHETNLTVSLWENFSIFESYNWINRITEFTKAPITEVITNCNWSYEWEKRITPTEKRLCDIVIHFETGNSNGVIVVEAKNLRKKLGEKDLNPDYYLEIDDFNAFDSKYLLYCVDEAVKEETLAGIPREDHIGMLTWQELASIQMAGVDEMEIPHPLKSFVKSALDKQFRSKGIIPHSFAEDYLEQEMNMGEYLEEPFKLRHFVEKIWKID